MASRTQEALRRAQMGRTITQAINDFIDAKQAENLSLKTLAWYRWLLEKFAASLEDQRLSTLTLAAARSFVAGLQARYEDNPISPRKEGGLSDYTISAYVGEPLDAFIAGDDPEAKATVSRLVKEGGLRAFDVGPLRRAPQLEGLGLLNITLQSTLEKPWMSGVKIVD